MPNQSNIADDFLKYLGTSLGKGFLEFILIIGAFFAPAAPILMTVGMAIALDTYFGRWKVRHTQGKEAISSKKMRIGLVPKAIGYALVVASVYFLDWAIINEFIRLFFPIDFIITKLAGLTLVYVEYTSMDESYYSVKGITLKQAFSNMLKTVRGFITEINKVKEDVKDLTKTEEDETTKQ